MESNVTIQQPTFDMTAVGQQYKQFELIQRRGKMYADSTLVPKAYQGNVANCAIAIDVSIRKNLDPLVVMQNLVIIDNKPTWSSKYLIAGVSMSGKYTALQYEEKTDGMIGKLEYVTYVWDAINRKHVPTTKTFDGSKIPNKSCKAWAIDKETGSRIEGITVDLRTAVREGWYTKVGSKWPTMPELMLRYRAASMWVNTNDPSINMGLMTQEEAEDINWKEADVIETKLNKSDRLAAVAAIAQEAAAKPKEEPQPVSVKVQNIPSQNEDLFAEPVK